MITTNDSTITTITNSNSIGVNNTINTNYSINTMNSTIGVNNTTSNSIDISEKGGEKLINLKFW